MVKGEQAKEKNHQAVEREGAERAGEWEIEVNKKEEADGAD